MNFNVKSIFIKSIPLLIAIILFGIIGTADYFLVETEFGVSIFYVIPIGLIAWKYGIRPGFAIAIISAVIHIAIATVDPANTATVQVWNAVTMGIVFLVVIVAIDIQRESKISQRKLMSFIVHDLRSPVTNIISGLQTLELILEDDTDDDAKEIIDMAEISGNRLLNLINSILDIDKFEHNSMVIVPVKVNINEIIEKATQEVAQWAKQENINIKLSNTTGLDYIVVDKDLTIRTLINILSNALKYSPKEGTITIQIYKKHENYIRFSVRDEGRGIPKEWQKKIFDKFTQVNGKHNGKPSTGLGLTFCREAITKQGGRIWVDDTVVIGTNIVFSLPTNVKARRRLFKKRQNKSV